MVCHRKEGYYNKRITPIIEGVGRTYSSSFTGLIGYTTPIGIAIQIYVTVVLEIPWQASLILILLPIIMMCLLIPVVLIHEDKIEKKRAKFIEKWKLEVLPKETFEVKSG